MGTTVLGYNLVVMPAWPAPRDVEYQVVDNDGMVVSPFSSAQYVYDWRNAHLEATLTMPPLGSDTIPAWRAFLMACRGRINVFEWGDPVAELQGSGAGTPMMDTSGSQNGFTMHTLGWEPGAAGVLKAGDWFGVNFRLYCATADVSADSNGLAAVPIWPNVRETPTGAAPLVLSAPKGLFRLKNSARKFSQTSDHTYGFTLEITEAL